MYVLDLYTGIYIDPDHKSQLHYHNDELAQYTDIYISYVRPLS